MAPSHGAGHASFDATFEMDSGDEFSGVYAKKRRISCNRGTRECSPMPTAGEFSRRSQNDVDISDFENIDAASSDDETLIIDPDILDVLADLPPKNQWTEHLVEYPVNSTQCNCYTCSRFALCVIGCWRQPCVACRFVKLVARTE